jgi:hypothetical protein
MHPPLLYSGRGAVALDPLAKLRAMRICELHAGATGLQNTLCDRVGDKYIAGMLLDAKYPGAWYEIRDKGELLDGGGPKARLAGETIRQSLPSESQAGIPSAVGP